MVRLMYGVRADTFGDLFRLILKIQRVFGLNIQNRAPTKRESLRAALFICLIVFLYGITIHAAFTDKDPETIGTCLVLNIGGMLNIMPKYLSTLYRGSKLSSLVKTVTQATDANAMADADFETKRLLRKYVNYAKITTNIQIASFAVCMVFVCITPYIYSVATNNWILVVPLKFVGVRNTSHPGYEVHTLFLIYMVAFDFIIMASVDTFLM